jgi:hypothetical protein
MTPDAPAAVPGHQANDAATGHRHRDQPPAEVMMARTHAHQRPLVEEAEIGAEVDQQSQEPGDHGSGERQQDRQQRQLHDATLDRR